MITQFGKSAVASVAIFVPCLMSPCLAQETTLSTSFSEHHPRRYQVLTEDSNLQNQINQDYGQLHGQYPQLNNAANGIRNEEQQYARQNGGFITIPEWQQLDNQETNLQNSINNDYAGANGQNTTSINPWQDYGTPASSPPVSGTPQTSTGLMSVQGGYTGQACGWAGNGGFPGLPPTSTSIIDLNTAF